MDAIEKQRMDIFSKTKEFTRAREAQAMGLYPFFIPFEDSEGTIVRYEGREIIMIGSNNYLGLTNDPRVIEASKKAIDDFGSSVTGSRFMNGSLAMHRELEERLANFIGKESVIVFSTGYQTNLGTISAIVGRGDVVITDKEDHASIIDGCMLSLGEMKRFRHNDMEDLERVLSRLPNEVGKLVAVDGVYSMGGDIAPVPALIEICQRYGARLLVDDAHSMGVLANGHGTAAHFGVTDDVDLITGTFSKSFASIGGFAGGDDDVMHYIQHHARSLIFSASLPAANTAAVLAALDIIESDPGYVQQVWDNANFMKQGLSELGFDIGQSETPIIPIIIGDDMRTIIFWKALFEEGLFTNPVIPPAVPPNKALLRTSYMATHTRDQLERALNILDEVGHRLDII
ncbi:MAG TPA: pyridoxal phosphate-dependent aminotransferase family protein [Aggregatilineales bacterium]|nr:pyridoxal phosphate-dependent aminotransferase family protein [Aggregatilineales bacterium]